MTSTNQSPPGATFQRSQASTGSAEGVVSYRLARQRAVEAYKRGDRSTHEMCDAQPELRRVAHNWGQPLDDCCPICEGDDLVSVTFAFGASLPKSGRVVATLSDAQKLRKRGKPSTCYTIEVCRQCWWNHLRESYAVSG